MTPESVPLNLLVTFNCDPVAGLHPGWWQRISYGELAVRLQDCATARPFLCRYLRRELGVDDSPVQEFSRPLMRIVLLPSEALDTLCLRLGCLRHGAALRRIVARQERQRVEAMLGPGVVEEALQGWLHRSVPRAWRIDALPADREAAVYSGMELLLAPLLPLPETVWSRLQLKLPPSWAHLGEAKEEETPQDEWLLQQIWEVLPSWRDLFA